MEKPSYRIGELARKADVTTRTIRYYESLGLLKSQPRSNGSQRSYTADDYLYLNRIKQLKHYGMSLEQIGQIIKLGNEDASGELRRLELLKQYRILLSKEMQRLQEVGDMIHELDWHVRQLESVDVDFKQCPGSACGRCEFKDRCEFYREEDRLIPLPSRSQ